MKAHLWAKKWNWKNDFSEKKFLEKKRSEKKRVCTRFFFNRLAILATFCAIRCEFTVTTPWPNGILVIFRWFFYRTCQKTNVRNRKIDFFGSKSGERKVDIRTIVNISISAILATFWAVGFEYIVMGVSNSLFLNVFWRFFDQTKQ